MSATKTDKKSANEQENANSLLDMSQSSVKKMKKPFSDSATPFKQPFLKVKEFAISKLLG